MKCITYVRICPKFDTITQKTKKAIAKSIVWHIFGC